MTVTVGVPGRAVLVAGIATAIVGMLWWGAGPAMSGEEPAPLATFAFIARADNPVDALAAGALAGQLGGPVYLTGSEGLDIQAAAGLSAAAPQVVVLAGGTAALSAQVEQEVALLLPEAEVRRIAGAGRTETARLLSDLPAELGIGRPVLTGATVTGDAGIDGTLTLDGVDVGTALDSLAARVDDLEDDLEAADERAAALESDVGSLTASLAAADGRIAALETTLAGVTRQGQLLTFAGMNVQITNGAGVTASTNGRGNLIVGYNEDHTTNECQPSPEDCQYTGDATADVRTGSHMLVLGVDHSYVSYGGIMGGLNNRAEGRFASVIGGRGNTASGQLSAILGGTLNRATASLASVTAGINNEATGLGSSVTGGGGGRASGEFASVSGGTVNTASGVNASISGGDGGTASAPSSSIGGGRDNVAGANHSVVAGGRGGTIADTVPNRYNSLIGNDVFPDS